MPQATSETHQQALPEVSGLPLWPEETEQEIGQLTALLVRTRPAQNQQPNVGLSPFAKSKFRMAA
jgi:hypothetical protein